VGGAAMFESALPSGPRAGRVPAGVIRGGADLRNPPRRPVRGRGQIVGASAGSLVVLPALLGGCSLPPRRRQRPVDDLRERRAWRAVAGVLRELIDPDGSGGPAGQAGADPPAAGPGAG